jgi:hypothetical protein
MGYDVEFVMQLEMSKAFVGDLFLFYQIRVNDECLRCVNFIPKIVLLRGCKC